jgi:hypothetical protein
MRATGGVGENGKRGNPSPFRNDPMDWRVGKFVNEATI